MAVPDYQSIMLPLLRLARDKEKHTISEAVEKLADEFNLSDAEQKELLPSGQQYTFTNRVGWARTYLKKAGLLSSPERGSFQITERGLAVLGQNPKYIGNKFLGQFVEFKEFKRRDKDNNSEKSAEEQESKTPEDLLEESYQDLYDSLTAELLEKIKSSTPQYFEKLVIDLLIKMGYGGSRRDAGQAVGKSGDGGIDGIIKEDKLGLDVIYIQAKRWENVVGRPIVQTFAGSLEGVRARRGIFITTSHFSKEAMEYVGNIEKKIVLIDGEYLARLMIDHDLGVSPVAKYEIKKVDSDYFLDE